MLRFPATVASNAELFDRVLNTMIDLAGRSEPGTTFAAWLARGDLARAEDRCILRDTYEVMYRLQNEGRNHIWGYVARNLARPVWLSNEAQKADVVIGNPPWLAFRHMKGELQERYRSEATAARVWWSGRGYFWQRPLCLFLPSFDSALYASRRSHCFGYALCGHVSSGLHPIPQRRSGASWPYRAMPAIHRRLDIWTRGPAVVPSSQLRVVCRRARRCHDRAIAGSSKRVFWGVATT